jgi:hypothetical protein
MLWRPLSIKKACWRPYKDSDFIGIFYLYANASCINKPFKRQIFLVLEKVK